MDLIGIIMMENIQREKFIVAVNCASSVKSMDCQQPEICESNQERKSYWMIIRWHNERTVWWKNTESDTLICIAFYFTGNCDN